jgi:type I site-specific restriction-modification system R (restriction) subunit
MAEESFLSLADVISGGALLVSIWSAVHATGIEKRLRRQDEKKAAFDQWIQNPVDAKLSSLDQCVYKFTAACGEHAKQNDRIEAIRKIQATEFDIWFFGFEALCDQQSDEVLGLVKEDLSDFLDEFLEQLNAAQAADDDADMASITRSMIHSEQGFVSRTKANLQSARLAIK